MRELSEQAENSPSQAQTLESELQLSDLSDVFDSARYFAAFKTIKSEFEKYVQMFTEGNGKKRRLVIFIDDLDRVEPEAAVKLLESIKNLIEVPNCIFVLALAKEIVKRGLKEKYEISDDDYYADQYFDKLIQLPFFIPTHTYDFTGLLGKDLATAQVLKLISLVANNNPRAVKRVMNMLSFYQLLKDGRGKMQKGYPLFHPSASCHP